MISLSAIANDTDGKSLNSGANFRVGIGDLSILLIVIKIAILSRDSRFLSKSLSDNVWPLETRSPSRTLRSLGSFIERVIFNRFGWLTVDDWELLLRDKSGVLEVTAIAPVPSKIKINI